MISESPKSRGFTLLEILLVILVIGIAASAFLPVAMQSVEHSRTRTALREVIAINRYARSRAILDRKPTAVVYRVDEDRMQLLSLPAQRDPEAETLFGVDPQEQNVPGAGQGVEVIRSRQLPKFVHIREVEGAEKEQDGYFVIYGENGVTFSHRIVVTDPEGEKHGIQVNGLTGEISLAD